LRPLSENQITEEEAFARISAPFHDFMLTQVRPKDLQLFADLSSGQGTEDSAAAAQPGAAVAAEAAVEPGSATAESATAESATSAPDAPAAEDVPLRVLVPAFMISELRRGFEIGFLIVLPFLVIDMIVATLVMSMGMMMMPPAVISLPFKILFFVLIDGWNLLVGGLVRSFF
jgi:flagellar biosynthetic protein FliP